MKITIVYDNECVQPDLQGDWGFACVIEQANAPTILFDTGADGEILLSNMEKLNISPNIVDMVFISHPHFDHIGGLAEFIRINPDITFVAPQHFRGVKRVKEVVYISDPQEIAPGYFSTGEIDGIEQALCIQLNDDVIVIAGCSHPGVERILEIAKTWGNPRALIGGFHGFNNFKNLSNLEYICPTHCTQFKKEIRTIFPKKIITGGAGATLTLS